MKSSEVVIGGVYSDGKMGVREVVSIEPDVRRSDDRVTYRILAAKVEQEYSYVEKKMVPVIGSESQCNLTSFTSWAKLKVEDVDGLLNDLSAKKLKLPPGEKAFMLSMGEALDGVSIEFAFNETRQARGVEKKGLADVSMRGIGRGGDLKLTSLGMAWMRANGKGG